MDSSTAIDGFAALAQPTRLKALRRLLKAFPAQLAAGEVAKACRVPHNTMSTHLAALTRAGLVSVQREGRMMRYAANLAGIHSLIRFLMRDCCGGRDELCAPLIAELSRCGPASKKQESICG